MKIASIALAFAVATGGLPGCTQTSLLKPVSGNAASATVESPILTGTTRITVSLDGKTYAGVAVEARKDTTGEQALRFGWNPAHKHPYIKQEMDFLFGSTILTAPDSTQLACDHLRHGDDWRLRCKRPGGGEILLQRVRK
ncbi:MAG: hypothetical protein KF766_08955 [Rhodocyclaceae bacterium]|nr:hypothetical protein [Rhodocyclaceae bacterium]